MKLRIAGKNTDVAELRLEQEGDEVSIMLEDWYIGTFRVNDNDQIYLDLSSDIDDTRVLTGANGYIVVEQGLLITARSASSKSQRMK